MHAQECSLYPIALSSQSLSKVSAGAVLTDVLNGRQPGNFGWLTWAGSPSEPTLVKSLTVPGDSATYANPDNSADHQINVGDWVRGKPGISNSKPVRDALNALTTLDIVVPLWDQMRGQGERAAYRVAAFARVRLLSYQLPGQNRITARFLGYASCDAVNLAPVVNAGADQTITLPNTAALNGSVTDDGLPTGGALTALWSVISGAGTVSFGNTNATATTAAFSAAGTYLLRLTATDSQLTNSDDVLIVVNRENHPPVASNLFMTNLEDMAMDIALHGSDPDGDTMSFSVVDDPIHGTVTGTLPNVRYTPFSDYNGMDAFTFRVNDGLLDSAVATVVITNFPINDPPLADSQSVTNLEDTPVTIPLSGADVEGAPLTFILVSAPTNGTLNVSVGPLSTNTVVYTPNSNYHGPDSFTFKVNDGEFDSAVATIAIDVQSVNDPPIVDAGPNQLITLPTNSVDLAGAVLDDYFDDSGLVVEWTKANGPGTVTFSNAFTNATAATFSMSGEYVLRLTAEDGFLTDSDEVTITVNAPPVVNAGTNQIITFPNSVTLNGTASDDGLRTRGAGGLFAGLFRLR